MFWKLSVVCNKDGPMLKHNSYAHTVTSILNPAKLHRGPREHESLLQRESTVGLFPENREEP